MGSVTYLWVDEILPHPSGVGTVGETTDMVKINYNRSQLSDDLQKTISIQLLPINEKPVLEAVVFLGRFLCYFTLDKDGNSGSMLLLDIRIKSDSEWEDFFQESCTDKTLVDKLSAAYKLSKSILESGLDFFELSIRSPF